MAWDELARDDEIERAAKALKGKGIDVYVVGSGAEAKDKLLSLIPKGSEVMEVSSTTLDQIGVTDAIEKSGDYVALRNRIRSVDDPVKRERMRRESAVADYCIGSVHAVTQDGQMLIASNSGSQIAPYAYTAGKLVLVAGTEKIVKDLDGAMKRLYEYVLPLENERVKKAYGAPGSSANKILLFEADPPGRTSLILVKEKLGF